MKGRKYLAVDKGDEQEFVTNAKLYYVYALQYIHKFPIYVKIGTVKISKMNAFKFCIGVAITKALSIGVKSWIDENYS